MPVDHEQRRATRCLEDLDEQIAVLASDCHVHTDQATRWGTTRSQVHVITVATGARAAARRAVDLVVGPGLAPVTARRSAVRPHAELVAGGVGDLDLRRRRNARPARHPSRRRAT